MVDDLVRSWGPRIKYVDDLTILEVIPCLLYTSDAADE